MPKAELSSSDIQLIADFARRMAKDPVLETIVAETFHTLKTVAAIESVRVVYSPRPSLWNEWKATPNSVEVRQHDEWPAPGPREVTVMFDPEINHAGYVSVNKTPPSNGKTQQALNLLAPEVWSAMLLESALQRAQKASLSETELVRETLRARDEERRHIARELHDDLGQSLASLRLSLKWVEDAARPKPDMAEAVQELCAAREAVGVMLGKLRDLSHTLYPRILDSLGLVSAIKELAHQSSRHSALKVRCTSKGKEKLLNKDVSVGLYRCCQEAISNAVRHADATTLEILIHFTEKEVRVSVEDNGKGFDPRAFYNTNSKLMSTGFWTIRQRMADLGGAFRISTAGGRGTVVEMIVPYPKRKYARGKNKVTDR